MLLKRPLIEGILFVIASAIVIPIGVYWIGDEPGLLLIMVYYPWNVLDFVLEPAIYAAIIGAVASIFIRSKRAFWTVFRPAYYICWGVLTIRFLMMMN